MRLRLEAEPGDDVDACATRAQIIADHLCIEVAFTFNTVECVANPGGWAPRLSDEYRRQLKLGCGGVCVAYS